MSSGAGSSSRRLSLPIPIPQKVVKYEAFLNDVLKVQLKNVLEQRAKVTEEISDYRRLKTTTAAFRARGPAESTAAAASCCSAPLKTRVDVGCGFLMSAVVPDADRVLVAVGFGFFLELTLDEADAYADRRIAVLADKDAGLARRGNEIKADIRIVLEGLRELQSLPGGLGDADLREEEHRRRVLELWS